MKNVSFRLADDVALEVRSLRETLNPVKANEPVTFDDVNSFEVTVDTDHRGGTLRFGKMTMRDADLEIVGDREGPSISFKKSISSS